MRQWQQWHPLIGVMSFGWTLIHKWGMSRRDDDLLLFYHHVDSTRNAAWR